MVNKKAGVKILAVFAKLQIPFQFSWDVLMDIVEKIEDLDLSEYYYTWDDERGVNYNFAGISVEIENNKCWVECRLELDPSVYLNETWRKKQQSLDYKETKKDAVFFSLVEAVTEINKIRNK